MSMALKKQRKRERRKAHAKQTGERNRTQGFTTSDLRRHGDNKAKARAASVVGRQTPSYHKPEPRDPAADRQRPALASPSP